MKIVIRQCTVTVQRWMPANVIVFRSIRISKLFPPFLQTIPIRPYWKSSPANCKEVLLLLLFILLLHRELNLFFNYFPSLFSFYNYSRAPALRCGRNSLPWNSEQAYTRKYSSRTDESIWSVRKYSNRTWDYSATGLISFLKYSKKLQQFILTKHFLWNLLINLFLT